MIYYLPELYFIFSIISVLIFNTYQIKINKQPLEFNVIFMQVITIILITIFLYVNSSIYDVSSFFFFTSPTTQNLKLLMLLIFINLFFLVWKSFIIQKLSFFEYFIIVLITLVGLLFLISSCNLISIYLCLEVQALGFYILASFDRNSIFSSEAGLKYFISSSLISGVFLFGSALLYGSFGTLNLHEILFLTTFFNDYLFNFSYFSFIFGSFLILNTLLFKLVIAPFHFWFPQIYDGAPLSSTILFSILPKVALINLFISFWSAVYNILFFFNTFFFLIGIYSTFFGIFKMLKQKRLKKLYIYSSISNFGLLLCILIDNTLESIFSIYFFIIIYILTSFLLWMVFITLYSNLLKNSNSSSTNLPIFLTSVNTLFYQNKIFALSICFIFFSLAAIPPFCGFLSKLYLFVILIKNNKYELSILLIYLGIFGSYYYIKFLKIVCFENILLTKQYQIKNIYLSSFFNLENTLYAFYLFLLIFLFIYPNFLLNFILLF